MKVLKALCVLLILAGCSGPIDMVGPQRYYFQHSMLNFDETSTYPKRFQVPEPLEESRVKEAPAVAQREQSSESATSEDLEDWHAVMEGLEPIREQEQEAVASEVVVDEGSGEDDSTDLDLSEDSLLDILGEDSEPTAETPGGDKTRALRDELRASAEALIGVKGDLGPEEFTQRVLATNEVEISGGQSEQYLRGLYKELRNRGLTYDIEEPLAGDLVFFHNTLDRNKDERNNDWYSGCGVVSQVRDDGSIVFVAVAGGEVKEMVMNLKNPDVRREEASQKVVNSFLRSKSLEDPEFTQYLAGELFAGFASVALP